MDITITETGLSIPAVALVYIVLFIIASVQIKFFE
jgi:hypothetical protein